MEFGDRLKKRKRRRLAPELREKRERHSLERIDRREDHVERLESRAHREELALRPRRHEQPEQRVVKAELRALNRLLLQTPVALRGRRAHRRTLTSASIRSGRLERSVNEAPKQTIGEEIGCAHTTRQRQNHTGAHEEAKQLAEQEDPQVDKRPVRIGPIRETCEE